MALTMKKIPNFPVTSLSFVARATFNNSFRCDWARFSQTLARPYDTEISFCERIFLLISLRPTREKFFSKVNWLHFDCNCFLCFSFLASWFQGSSPQKVKLFSPRFLNKCAIKCWDWLSSTSDSTESLRRTDRKLLSSSEFHFKWGFFSSLVCSSATESKSPTAMCYYNFFGSLLLLKTM